MTQSNHLFESKATNNCELTTLVPAMCPYNMSHSLFALSDFIAVIMWYEPVSSRHWYVFYWMKSQQQHPTLHQLSARDECCHILMRSCHIWKESRLFSLAAGFTGHFNESSFKDLPIIMSVFICSAAPQDGWCWGLLHPQQQEWGRSNRCRESYH